MAPGCVPRRGCGGHRDRDPRAKWCDPRTARSSGPCGGCYGGRAVAGHAECVSGPRTVLPGSSESFGRVGSRLAGPGLGVGRQEAGTVITEGYLARHYHGRRGGRDPALLDVAQDYALRILADSGIFDLGLVFKGGTAMRKYRAGQSGRFSTDLDFSAVDADLGSLIFAMLSGASIHDVRFEVEEITPGSRGLLRAVTPLGSPVIPAKIEVSTRPVWLPAGVLQPVHMAVHDAYEFTVASLPVMALEEAVAEKLAAFRRRKLGRDLFDLAWLAKQPFDETSVRELTYLKVFHDVVDDALGRGPFEPAIEILGDVDVRAMGSEDMGLLVGRVEPDVWLLALRSRFRFLCDAADPERRWARCSVGDRYAAGAAVERLSARSAS
ncbi:MAG: hypothetical protein C0418_02255 [Coriobacteriaceae bacterium]|nr:hypothetical protein [Coriobacteriaceae bacterium]